MTRGRYTPKIDISNSTNLSVDAPIILTDDTISLDYDTNSIGDPVSFTDIGWHFDGLSRGIHLEIKYESEKNELTVQYKGYTVYREIAGELMSYAPFPEWEEKTNQLFKTARGIQVQILQKEKKEKIESANKSKEKWWDKVKHKWGL